MGDAGGEERDVGRAGVAAGEGPFGFAWCGGRRGVSRGFARVRGGERERNKKGGGGFSWVEGIRDIAEGW